MSKWHFSKYWFNFVFQALEIDLEYITDAWTIEEMEKKIYIDSPINFLFA